MKLEAVQSVFDLGVALNSYVDEPALKYWASNHYLLSSGLRVEGILSEQYTLTPHGKLGEGFESVCKESDLNFWRHSQITFFKAKDLEEYQSREHDLHSYSSLWLMDGDELVWSFSNGKQTVEFTGGKVTGYKIQGFRTSNRNLFNKFTPGDKITAQLKVTKPSVLRQLFNQTYWGQSELFLDTLCSKSYLAKAVTEESLKAISRMLPYPGFNSLKIHLDEYALDYYRKNEMPSLDEYSLSKVRRLREQTKMFLAGFWP